MMEQKKTLYKEKNEMAESKKNMKRNVNAASSKK